MIDDDLEVAKRAYRKILILEQMMQGLHTNIDFAFTARSIYEFAGSMVLVGSHPKMPKIELSTKTRKMGLDNYQHLNRRLTIDTLPLKRAH